MNEQLLNDATVFVKSSLASHDSSHDWFHIERVRNLAKTLGQREGLSEESLYIVELCALLHDIKDWKYSGSDTAGIESATAFLREHNVPDETIDRITTIISRIGFKDELNGTLQVVSPELAVVQDADRLDAIGAIGIARCFTYGGAKGRSIHDPEEKPRLNLTKEEYQKSESSSINHFHEKLLTLRGLMKSAAGKAVAEERHAFLVTYLDQFYAEWEGKA